MYRVALDISQAKPEQVIYIDDREMFVEVARGLESPALRMPVTKRRRSSLEALGLSLSN